MRKKELNVFGVRNLNEDFILNARLALYQGGQFTKREFVRWTSGHTGLTQRTIENQLNKLGETDLLHF